MDIICPHCNNNGVTPISKFLAFPGNPAKCTRCGKLSSVKQGISFNLILACSFAYMLACYAVYGFIYPNLLIMYLSLLGIPGIIIASYYFVPLVKITTKESKKEGLVFKISAVLVVLYIFYEVNEIVQIL